MKHRLADGVGLEYEIQGDRAAPALLLLNSLGTDMSMWEQQLDAFSATHRVVRFDQRGQGASDAPPEPYSIETLGADALNLMDSLGLQRFSICGLSMSGLTAMWMAATRPDRIDRAVFANTAAVIGDEKLWDERIEKVRTEGMAKIRDEVLARFFTPRLIRAGSNVVRHFARMLEEAPPEGYIGGCAAVRDADLGEMSKTIWVPCLIVAGAEDVATPVTESEWLAEHIVDSELVILEDAAHISCAEQPRRFNEAVGRFLAGAAA
jgi:3-oxoadipate enol-lactonase